MITRKLPDAVRLDGATFEHYYEVIEENPFFEEGEIISPQRKDLIVLVASRHVRMCPFQKQMDSIQVRELLPGDCLTLTIK